MSPTSDNFTILQTSIDQLVKSSAAWGLMMNVNKCVAIRFAPKSSTFPYSGLSSYKINDDYIKFVNCHSDVGV